MRKVILISLLLFSLTACSFDKVVENKKSTLYTSYDNLFSVEASNKWQNVNKGTLNELANLEIADYDNNKYFMALMEKKEDLEWSYEEYIDYMIDDIEKTYKVQIETKEKIKINDKDATYVEFKSSSPSSSVNFYMQIYIIETKNYYGRLFTWTVYSKRDEYKKEFQNIVKTFKEN